jgi:predicted GIY-YIG superfamily endonuclease
MSSTNYIYILSLEDGSYYVNATDILTAEISLHTKGEIPATAGKSPQLVWTEEWADSETLQKRVALLSELSKDAPSDLLYILQARLPFGGYHWG